MGYYLLLVMIPSLCIVLLSRFVFRREITNKEWGLQVLGLLLTTSISMGLLVGGKYFKVSDFDIINGQVLSKERQEVSCEHEYQCGKTCSGKGDKRTCSPKYCHEHAYDVDWDVETSVGDYTIDRIDRRGLGTPPRWAMINIGDPVANTESVSNYMLADDERFKTDETISNKYKDKLPSYPKPYDYYRYNRIVNDTKIKFEGMNEFLNNQLIKYGKLKQLNIIIVITHNDINYYNALREYWKGTRKNDVILYYGIDNDANIAWFKADTFADGEDNQSLLQELKVRALGDKLSLNLVKDQFNIIVKDFKRIPNSQFEYLASNWSPPIWGILLVTLINMIGTCIIALYFKENEIV